ncbi:DUF1501 domain-containing protein [Acidobacteria bacterium AH-259-G07]|nr:DUF1501 domain-containing protein [Acidobacteria bacterium AH-259-G07]
MKQAKKDDELSLNPTWGQCTGFGPSAWSRRDFLSRSCNGLGALALAGLLAEELGATPSASSPLASRPQHFPRKAKHCIFLFMSGGVSQVDTFDYKPALEKFAGQRVPKMAGFSGEIEGFLSSPHRVIPSPWEFKRMGESGHYVSTLFPHLSECVDDLAFIFGIEVDNNNHGPATLHVNTGSQFPGHPSVGAWITYGLGSPNQNLPGYVVIQDPRGAPINGAGVRGSGFLPASYQGTLFRSVGTPILELEPPKRITRQQQREEFDLLNWLNRRHQQRRPDFTQLEARINAYELAFRMQSEAPEVVDLSKESEVTRKMYGLDNPVTEAFGRQCLLAKRLIQRGVRYSLVVHGVENGKTSWDDHGNIKGRLPRHVAEVDQPVAALLKDLKREGLLEETLVVWASEMGRTAFINDLDSDKPGRDHNQYGLVMWLAGGDVQGGSRVGETDEFGIGAVGESIHMRDVHATILDLLGLSDERLTYLHDGRFRRLTDIGGKILKEIIA